MGAHLHVVPDEPYEAPALGDRPVLAPVPTPAVAPGPEPEPDAVRSDEDDVLVQDDEETSDLGDYDEEEAPRGFMTVPDLRPYVDPRPLAALGPLAVEAGKTVGPPVFRAICWLVVGLGRMLMEIGRIVAWYCRGIGVLLVLLAGWLSGKFGKGSVGARFGGAAFLVYAVAKLSTQYEIALWITLGVLVVAVALAAGGHIEIPESKPAKKETDKGDGKAKGKKGKGSQTPGKGKSTAADEDTEEGGEETTAVSKETPADAPRKVWTTRLLRRPASPDDAPADPPAGSPEEAEDEASEEAPEEVQEDEEETPAEALPAPSRDAVIEALHHLYRGGSGVLLTVLSDHLSTADTRALKEVLGEVEIPHRTGVRTPAGNGPGVHREDIPFLPFSQRGPQGVGVVAGQPANANANNAANTPGEGLGVDPTDWWSREQVKRGFRSVPDPERGPTASKIERWGQG